MDLYPACDYCVRAILDLSREKDVQKTTRSADAGNDLERERRTKKKSKASCVPRVKNFTSAVYRQC